MEESSNMHQESLLSSQEEEEMIELQINPQSSYFLKFDDSPIYNENGLNGEQVEVLQVHQLSLEHTVRNQQEGYVGQQYIEPSIIAKEVILCKKEADKEVVYHCIEEHNDAHGSKINNLFEGDHMSYSNVKKIIFLPEDRITNYFQSRDEKWRHESDIDHFIKDIADCSAEHIIPTKGSIE